VKPTLVILSGWAYPTDAWQDLRTRLDPFCDVHVLDPLELLDRWDPSDLSDKDRKRILDLLDTAAPTYLAGWSLGGMLAVRIAEAYGSRLDGLCLVGTPLKFCRDQTQRWGADPRRVRSMQEGLSKRPISTLKAFHHLAAHPCRPLDAVNGSQLAAMVNEKLEALDTGLDYLLRADLRSCDFALFPETVILHGSGDSIIPAEAGRELRATILNAQFNEFPDVGHDLPVRYPEIMVETLTRLIGVDQAIPPVRHESFGHGN
jgi:pimeloyl-[acyl-carrier protein] methyl ester esterase